MSKNKKIILTFSLMIIIILSFLLFFGVGNGNKMSIQISSFVFVILDEIIAYSMILLLTESKQKAFSIAGLSAITCIYIVISLIINIILKSIFFNMKSLLIVNFAFLLIYLFVVTLLLLVKEEK